MNSSYRENSLSAGDSLRPPHPSGREGLSPAPSPASRPTAAPGGSCGSRRRAHPASGTHAAHPSPCSLPAAPLPLAAPPSRFGTWLGERGHRGAGSAPRGRSGSHGGTELSYTWTAHCSRKHRAACPVLSSRVSTNHGRWFAAALCPEHKWHQSRHLPPPPPYSPQPHPHGDRPAILQQPSHRRGAAGAEAAPSAPPGSWGLLGQPPAPSTRLLPPRRDRRRRGRQGREREGGGGSCCCPGFPRIKYEQPCCVILNC